MAALSIVRAANAVVSLLPACGAAGTLTARRKRLLFIAPLTMLSEAVSRHIELYRSMGFKYVVQAYMLRSFADFAQVWSEDFVLMTTPPANLL
jgi:hypothetical protein